MSRVHLVRLAAGLCSLALGLTRAVAQPTVSPPATAAATLLWEDAVYVSLPALNTWFGITSSPAAVAAQKVPVQADGHTCEFLNGGDRVQLPDGRDQPLTHPLLVIGGTLYLHQQEAAALLQVQVSSSAVTFHDRTMAAAATRLDTRHHTHRVTGLTPVNYGLRLIHEVPARRALHDSAPIAALPAGSTYVCRRQVTLDGTPFVLLTATGDDPQTYLVAAAALEGQAQPADLTGTTWAKRLAWFQSAAKHGLALRSGARASLVHALSATADFCWSLRAMESDFLLNTAPGGEHGAPPALTVFISGRWLEQHPADMETLIALDQGGSVALNWGLHSWVHPKAGEFMDDLPADVVRSDTLRLESLMLEWGIVPTVYYRFPGLIHDTLRLDTILAMDLLPIDCDAWVAVQTEDGHPFGGAIRDGSIVLVHGNGNEPIGISRFQRWLRANPGWQWRPLAEFLPTVGGRAP